MKRFDLSVRTFCFFAGLFMLATLNAQNLVNDPGFEASTDNPIGGNAFSPAWTLVELNGFSTVSGSPLDAHLGNNAGSLAPDFGAIGSLSQVLSTTAGQIYTLSFWLASDSSVPPNLFAVYWGGTQIYSATNLVQFNYTQLSFNNLAASGNSTTLEFQYQNDDSFFRLDDVSVTAVPEWSAKSFAIVGFGFLGFVCWRRNRGSRFGVGL